jgi:hypothetical protein
MSEWKKSNYAHWGTYRDLVVQKEIDASLVSFEDAETYQMPGLAFYVFGAGSDDLNTRAEFVAMELYNFIVANYAPDWQDRTQVDSIRKALNKMIAVLINRDKSISDLANCVDEIFKFSNEK